MAYLWLVVAVISTVGYHLALKLTPEAANPYLSLAAAYAVGGLIFAIGYVMSPGAGTFRVHLQTLSWTPLALAAAVVVLDLAYLMLYRAGYELSFGQLVTQSSAALLLVVLGVAVFREKLSLANVGGILLCIAGLWLINRK